MSATETRDHTVLAHGFARTAREGFVASAAYFRSLPEDAWHGPTGCTKWDMRHLAEHITGEAVWFPNLVRGATRGEAPLPAETYEEHKRFSSAQLADATEQAAAHVQAAIEEATPEQLEQEVDMGFAKLPIWTASYISLFEGVYHNWDTRAGREADVTIPTPWALQLATLMAQFGPMIAHQKEAATAAGTYLLRVGDGVGPVTVDIRDGAIALRHASEGTPDITVDLTADQYVRLIAGRFKLEGSNVPIEGDRGRAAALNRVFGGVANE